MLYNVHGKKWAMTQQAKQHCIQGGPQEVSHNILHYILHYILLRQILADFQNSFTVTFSRKFGIKPSLNIPPHLKHIATLPCEILMSEKYGLQHEELSVYRKYNGHEIKHISWFYYILYHSVGVSDSPKLSLASLPYVVSH